MYYYIGKESLNLDFYLCERNIDVFCVPHIHYSAEFVFVLDGELILTKDEKTLTLKKDDMAIIMPYEIHGFKTEKHSDTLVIGFQPDYISEYKHTFMGKTFENHVTPMTERIKSHILEFSQSIETDIFEIKSLIYSVIAEFMKKSTLTDSKTAQNDTLRRAMIYISKHYAENISLKKVAFEIGVTSVHLSRTLNSASVMCFTDIVNCLRLREAKRLLEQTDIPISELAYEAGFGSIRNFNRLFEKYFNCTPKDVRNKSVKVNFLVRGGVVEE